MQICDPLINGIATVNGNHQLPVQTVETLVLELEPLQGIGIVHRWEKNGPHSEPTRAFLKLSSDTFMSVPFRCTHPPLPVPPFLLAQNLSPKEIARSEITSSNFYVSNAVTSKNPFLSSP